MNYSILVNTCDKFEDCWDPFFKLFSVYWAGFDGIVYLNTEYKSFNYSGINVKALKVCEKMQVPTSSRATWSQCLKWALESIDTDVVLYMQEDYFLKEKVDSDKIQEYFDYMVSNPEVQCIYLHSHAVEKDGGVFSNGLRKVKTEGWRLSCQAALWRKQELLDIIREYESPWEFENFGNKRSVMMNHLYLTVDKAKDGTDFTLIPYVFTGIIKGKWLEECVQLFKMHNIQIDFSKRGFYRKTNLDLNRPNVKYYIDLIPKFIVLFWDLMKLSERYSIHFVLKVLFTKYNKRISNI